MMPELDLAPLAAEFGRLEAAAGATLTFVTWAATRRSTRRRVERSIDDDLRWITDRSGRNRQKADERMSGLLGEQPMPAHRRAAYKAARVSARHSSGVRRGRFMQLMEMELTPDAAPEAETLDEGQE